MALALKDVDALLNDLAVTIQNKTAESAAQVAKLYGASDEAVQAILRLKTKEGKAA
ncbi:hypothetical protein [Bradyrhizobium sp. 87]|uniref:hypothetical protein n=1 Tax=Bradyrhizobium sp. 87 TaxID=2782682 RepID=UPI001FF9C937|nr:hypothetical protein [Bradyrhizobium sp. 87]MCK1430878.1 hypothetical protein [Bradyrhizobium sp. 87]